MRNGPAYDQSKPFGKLLILTHFGMRTACLFMSSPHLLLNPIAAFEHMPGHQCFAFDYTNDLATNFFTHTIPDEPCVLKTFRRRVTVYGKRL